MTQHEAVTAFLHWYNAQPLGSLRMDTHRIEVSQEMHDHLEARVMRDRLLAWVAPDGGLLVKMQSVHPAIDLIGAEIRAVKR